MRKKGAALEVPAKESSSGGSIGGSYFRSLGRLVKTGFVEAGIRGWLPRRTVRVVIRLLGLKHA